MIVVADSGPLRAHLLRPSSRVMVQCPVDGCACTVRVRVTHRQAAAGGEVPSKYTAASS
jgi:hypothetical protein